MSCSASGTYSLPSAFMKSYCVSTSQKMTRGTRGGGGGGGMNFLLGTVGNRGNLSGGRCECQPTPQNTLQRQRDRHLVAGMLPRTARAIRPDFQRKLLL